MINGALQVPLDIDNLIRDLPLVIFAAGLDKNSTDGGYHRLVDIVEECFCLLGCLVELVLIILHQRLIICMKFEDGLDINKFLKDSEI